MDGRSYDGRELRVAMAKYGRPEGGRGGGGGGGGGGGRGSGYGYDRRRRYGNQNAAQHDYSLKYSISIG